MDSDKTSVNQLFKPERQYCVPFYQRAYVWNQQDQWSRLWSDIQEKAEARLNGLVIPPQNSISQKWNFLVIYPEEVPLKKSRFTDSQILGVLKQAEAGTPVPELCRTHGISSATFYKWRSQYGGMDASMISQMKALEEENRRLKKMYAEAQMSADILKEALAKKW